MMVGLSLSSALVLKLGMIGLIVTTLAAGILNLDHSALE